MEEQKLVNKQRKNIDTISKEVGANIRKKREEQGKTMNEFCIDLMDYGLDISDYILGKYERGQRRIPLDRLFIIIKALHVKYIDEIFPKEIPWEI